MKILLINDNPVVSRMLALCTRDVRMQLDEVKRIDAIKDVTYDLLFVDDASYVDHIDTLLQEESIRKKVFISYDGDAAEGFDETIKKPFLPSQIMNVIESIDMSEVLEEKAEENISIFPLSTEEEIVEEDILPDIFPLPTEDDDTDNIVEMQEDSGPEILNVDEIEKIKALLDMDDDEDVHVVSELLSDDEYEARKVKVIKEQLIADGLEIVEENEIVEELSISSLDTFEAIDKKLHKKKKSKKKNKKKNLEIHFNKNELSRIEDAIVTALGKMKPKKIKKLFKGKKIEVKIKLEDDK